MSSIKAKIMDFFANKDYMDILFILLGLKMCIFSVSLGDSAIILGFLGFKSYNLWLQSKEAAKIPEDYQKELSDIKNTMGALGLRSPVKVANEPPKRFF